MAGDILIKHGTPQTDSAMGTALNAGLATGNTGTGDAFTVLTNDELDVLYELTIKATSTPSTNDQVILYVITSDDGTDYSDSTNEENKYLLGVVYVPDTTAVRSKLFSVAAACGGTLPGYFKVQVKNDMGVTTDTSGNPNSAKFTPVYAQYT